MVAWQIVLRRMNQEAEVMGWVLFEVLLAFGLAIFIVWWTFPKKKKAKRPPDQRATSSPSKDG